MIRAAFLLAALALSGAEVVYGQPITQAAQRISDAQALLTEAGDSADHAPAVAGAVLAYEDAIEALRTTIVATDGERRRLERILHEDAAIQRRILAGLQRLSSKSDPLLALSARDPADIVRAALLLERVVETARAKMRGTEAQIETLTSLRAVQVEQQTHFQSVIGDLKATQAQLITMSDIVNNNSDIPDLGQDASNLTALAIALDGLPDGSGGGAVPETRFELPAFGHAVTEYNTLGPRGLRRPGISLGVQPGTLVVSPARASVRFAGELDGYGVVVILEPAPGQLFVLAGLDRLLVRAGIQVTEGTGLGFLPGEPALHKEFLSDEAEETSESVYETLYIEVRVDGKPVDPGNWFAFDS